MIFFVALGIRLVDLAPLGIDVVYVRIGVRGCLVELDEQGTSCKCMQL